jgi:hypothetical protein
MEHSSAGKLMKSFLMCCQKPSGGSFFCLAQHGFDLSQHLFDWIENSQVGWQEQKMGNGSADHASNGRRHLWLVRLSMTTRSSNFGVGTSTCST